MRHKSFLIQAVVADYSVYDNDLPSLAYVRISHLTVSNTLPKHNTVTGKWVNMTEDNPMFNFDLLVNKLLNIDDNRLEFFGEDVLEQLIIKYFPHVMEYYRDNELI